MSICRRAYTIIETVIVVLMVGIAAALVAPTMARRSGAPANSPEQVVGFARHSAIDRAQALFLVIGRDGRWSLAEEGMSQLLLAKGLTSSPQQTVQLAISPAGICIPYDETAETAVNVDPVSCALHFASPTSR